jgi:hypothetical protein
VLTASALLQMGYTRAPRDFLEWYAQFQFDDGRIPCCVDEGGADRVPENDSDGEFIYGVMEVYRYTHDVGFVREMWPHVLRAVDHLKALRAQRMTAEYRAPEKQAFFGLVPESISHEGYSDRPVHSYWDDFFALRGLKDAARLAIVMADSERVKELAKLRDDFRADLYRSIARTTEKHHVDYLPASVELGDFDPNSTAIAIEPGGEMQNLPATALRRTYDEYYEFFRRRRSGEEEWNSLTPYEVRNVGIFVRLGERERAHEILDFLLANQRPEPWNEWQEILWRDPRSPRFIGDMPHTWVAAGFVRSVRAMLAYERESDEALVLAAGVPEAWVSGGKHVGVKRLPTYFGVLSYTLESERPGSLTLRMSGDLEVPPGGIVLRPPLSRPIAAVRVNGKAVKTFSADQAVVSEFPAEVVMELAPAKSASKRR